MGHAVTGVIQDRDLTISKRDVEISAQKDELVAVRASLTRCEGQIKDLKTLVARLDKTLAEELEKEDALKKNLDAELLKEAELEIELAVKRRKEEELQKYLEKTKAELEKDEQQLADDKKIFESKDAEIADLKKRLTEVQKKHEPCDGLIKTLREKITLLETSRDKLQNAIEAKDTQIDEMKKMLGDNLLQILMKMMVEHRDMKVQIEKLTKEHSLCPEIIGALHAELEELKRVPESSFMQA